MKADTVPSSAEQVVTLRLINEGDPLMDVLVAAFQEKHPGVRVELVNMPVEATTTFEGGPDWTRQQIESGNADVTLMWDTIKTEQYFRDLEPFIQRTGFDLKPFGPLDALRQNGKLYMLPMERYPLVLVYNRALFASAQVQAPVEGWTWNDLREAAHRIASMGEGKNTGIVVGRPQTLSLLYAGKNPEKADRRAGYEFVATLIATDHAMPAPEGAIGTISSKAFLDGHAGMALLSVRSLSGRVLADWDYAPLPVRPGHPSRNIVSARPIGIAATSKHPKEAWELLQFMVGPEGTALAAGQGRLFSYLTPAAEAAWFARDPQPSENSRMLFSPEWAPEYVWPKPANLSPQQEREYADLIARAQQAENQIFSDAAHWEQHYAEATKLDDQARAIREGTSGK